MLLREKSFHVNTNSVSGIGFRDRLTDSITAPVTGSWGLPACTASVPKPCTVDDTFESIPIRRSKAGDTMVIKESPDREKAPISNYPIDRNGLFTFDLLHNKETLGMQDEEKFRNDAKECEKLNFYITYPAVIIIGD